MTATIGSLARMAEAVRVVKVDDKEQGMVECKAPGCDNWFHKNSGRHVYCKADDCTYRRGAPPAPELVSPEGAAEELLRRLQESDEAEVGPSQFADRVRAVQAALRAADPEALFGALIDVSAAGIWWADRAKRGELPKPSRRAPAEMAPAGRSGLVAVVIASHQRTYALGDQRVSLLWELIDAREHLASTELAMEQTRGAVHEADTREALRAARARVESAERAFQSVEAAWRERGAMQGELQRAAAAGAPPIPTTGAQDATAA
jgi:hypothetical protein